MTPALHTDTHNVPVNEEYIQNLKRETEGGLLLVPSFMRLKLLLIWLTAFVNSGVALMCNKVDMQMIVRIDTLRGELTQCVVGMRRQISVSAPVLTDAVDMITNKFKMDMMPETDSITQLGIDNDSVKELIHTIEGWLVVAYTVVQMFAVDDMTSAAAGNQLHIQADKIDSHVASTHTEQQPFMCRRIITGSTRNKENVGCFVISPHVLTSPRPLEGIALTVVRHVLKMKLIEVSGQTRLSESQLPTSVTTTDGIRGVAVALKKQCGGTDGTDGETRVLVRLGDKSVWLPEHELTPRDPIYLLPSFPVNQSALLQPAVFQVDGTGTSWVRSSISESSLHEKCSSLELAAQSKDNATLACLPGQTLKKLPLTFDDVMTNSFPKQPVVLPTQSAETLRMCALITSICENTQKASPEKIAKVNSAAHVSKPTSSIDRMRRTLERRNNRSPTRAQQCNVGEKTFHDTARKDKSNVTEPPHAEWTTAVSKRSGRTTMNSGASALSRTSRASNVSNASDASNASIASKNKKRLIPTNLLSVPVLQDKYFNSHVQSCCMTAPASQLENNSLYEFGWVLFENRLKYVQIVIDCPLGSAAQAGLWDAGNLLEWLDATWVATFGSQHPVWFEQHCGSSLRASSMAGSHAAIDVPRKE